MFSSSVSRPKSRAAYRAAYCHELVHMITRTSFSRCRAMLGPHPGRMRCASCTSNTSSTSFCSARADVPAYAMAASAPAASAPWPCPMA